MSTVDTLVAAVADYLPEDRVQAHLEGWKHYVDLLEEVFESKSWSVGYSKREGNRVDWIRKSTPSR